MPAGVVYAHQIVRVRYEGAKSNLLSIITPIGNHHDLNAGKRSVFGKYV